MTPSHPASADDAAKAGTVNSAIHHFAVLISSAPIVAEPTALARARDALTDTVACMIAGATSPVARSAFDAVGQWGSGKAALAGQTARLNPPFAAMINGAAAHALDFDDFDAPANAHPSAVIFPALLALASERVVSGTELLDAHIVGVEVIQRLGEAMNMDHYRRGWLSTLTLGTVAAAAACARLTRADYATAVSTLSLGASMASGLTNQGGYLAKQLHPGLAANNGVMAATLAAAGITASQHTLDGPISLARSMGSYEPQKFAQALAKLAQPWSIVEHGLITKIYPTCGYAHRIIDAAIKLRAQLPPDTRNIAALDISVPEYYLDLLIYDVPQSAAQAMFSAPYNVATALVTGRFDLGSLETSALTDNEVIRLCQLACVSGRTPADASIVYDPADPDTVTATLRDGTCITATTGHVPGCIDKPPGLAALRRKFDDCVARHSQSHDGERLWSMLCGITTMDDCRPLLEALRLEHQA